MGWLQRGAFINCQFCVTLLFMLKRAFCRYDFRRRFSPHVFCVSLPCFWDARPIQLPGRMTDFRGFVCGASAISNGNRRIGIDSFVTGVRPWAFWFRVTSLVYCKTSNFLFHVTQKYSRIRLVAFKACHITLDWITLDWIIFARKGDWDPFA